jgi:hypothetical protein
MKRLLILFGVLDIITLIRLGEHAFNTLNNLSKFSWVAMLSILIYVSLIFSAYFLIRQSKIGCWLTYAQLPLRAAFFIPSFGFLITYNRAFFSAPDNIVWLMIALEILRLFFTILIHRKLVLSSKILA